MAGIAMDLKCPVCAARSDNKADGAFQAPVRRDRNPAISRTGSWPLNPPPIPLTNHVPVSVPLQFLRSQVHAKREGWASTLLKGREHHAPYRDRRFTNARIYLPAYNTMTRGLS